MFSLLCLLPLLSVFGAENGGLDLDQLSRLVDPEDMYKHAHSLSSQLLLLTLFSSKPTPHFNLQQMQKCSADPLEASKEYQLGMLPSSSVDTRVSHLPTRIVEVTTAGMLFDILCTDGRKLQFKLEMESDVKALLEDLPIHVSAGLTSIGNSREADKSDVTLPDLFVVAVIWTSSVPRSVSGAGLVMPFVQTPDDFKHLENPMKLRTKFLTLVMDPDTKIKALREGNQALKQTESSSHIPKAQDLDRAILHIRAYKVAQGTATLGKLKDAIRQSRKNANRSGPRKYYGDVLTHLERQMTTHHWDDEVLVDNTIYKRMGELWRETFPEQAAAEDASSDTTSTTSENPQQAPDVSLYQGIHADETSANSDSATVNDSDVNESTSLDQKPEHHDSSLTQSGGTPGNIPPEQAPGKSVDVVDGSKTAEEAPPEQGTQRSVDVGDGSADVVDGSKTAEETPPEQGTQRSVDETPPEQGTQRSVDVGDGSKTAEETPTSASDSVIIDMPEDIDIPQITPNLRSTVNQRLR